MDLKDIISKIAPLAEGLAAAFGGPPGIAASLAMKAVCGVFGLSPDTTTPEQLQTTVARDPEAALKIMLAENAFKLQMFQAQVADVQNARQREASVVQATGKKDYNLYILAWTIVLGFFSLTGILMVLDTKAVDSPVVTMLFGGLVAGFTQVLSYFFGSSKGSAEKSETIKNMKQEVHV